MKACTKCGEVKPLDQFYKNCRHKDGHAYYCNKALGLFNDDVSVLLKAVEYLGGGSNECTEYPAEG